MLAIFSFSKAVSQYILYIGERSRDIDTAVTYFKTASRIDPDNPGAELAAAESLAKRERWLEAVPHFQRAIDRGLGVSLIYSNLANAQEMTADLSSAERTLRKAAEIFPRSTFIRARLAIVLENQGRKGDADELLAFSRTIDERQTNGWYSVIKYGIMQAHLNAKDEPEKYEKPPKLLPAGAIYAYNDEKVRVEPN